MLCEEFAGFVTEVRSGTATALPCPNALAQSAVPSRSPLKSTFITFLLEKHPPIEDVFNAAREIKQG
jgi:hypothetical protein